MAYLDENGMFIAEKISLNRFPSIEHGDLSSVSAIVVHQTAAPTAKHTFNSYEAGGNGAHFLIAKNGSIYQTASVHKRCYHVGRLIKAKCLSVVELDCDSSKMDKILTLSWSRQIKAINKHERLKNYPQRYPVNSDSIGIEIVGKHLGEEKYEPVSKMQNASLKWLVKILYDQFGISSGDVYKHPDISYKNPGEAATAKWK
ncbi:N-acetylmuramoyl-L-alanine amidase [Marinobacterium stanieri]|uniref:peptidoglycan recognition protein family protein n=1 Tax=Marinobacterium stanieri TaxID=49186 RepID=UPI0002557888|nr:peptidoglycan recognition family protein [Marinobacterium stanieri]